MTANVVPFSHTQTQTQGANYNEGRRLRGYADLSARFFLMSSDMQHYVRLETVRESKRIELTGWLAVIVVSVSFGAATR